MGKITWKAGTFVYPIPAVLISCGDEKEKNILTVAWTGTICTDPAMAYISIRKERYSYNIINRTKEFCINLTNEELAFATDFCGVKSGKNIDKFKEMKLTPQKASIIKAPMIKESPVSIECIVKEVKELGSHDMFIAEVVAINIDEKYLDENGKFDMEKCKLIAYSHGEYFKLGEKIGKFGYSVKKN